MAVALALKRSPTMAYTYRVCMVYDRNTVCFFVQGNLISSSRMLKTDYMAVVGVECYVQL